MRAPGQLGADLHGDHEAVDVTVGQFDMHRASDLGGRRTGIAGTAGCARGGRQRAQVGRVVGSVRQGESTGDDDDQGADHQHGRDPGEGEDGGHASLASRPSVVRPDRAHRPTVVEPTPGSVATALAEPTRTPPK